MSTLIFEYHKDGGSSFDSASAGVNTGGFEQREPTQFKRESALDLPEVAEGTVVRHYVRLSSLNHHVDKDIYPLGSCTMKYNPKVNDGLAFLEGFTNQHPAQPDEQCQGSLRLIHALGQELCAITGFSDVTLQPVAGSHGELTALFMIRKYHESRGNARRKVVIPDSAHGTNPASITLAGYEVVEVGSDEHGMLDLEHLARVLDEDVAAFMITNPNTLGIYDSHIARITEMVHGVGALCYMDGANLNALLGLVQPARSGFDIMHINLHKTFAVPHGGGGPGAGPLVVGQTLAPFLPGPVTRETPEGLRWVEPEQSIGRVHMWNGNFGALVRAYAYIRRLGARGLRRVSENAILNANYIRARLKDTYRLGFESPTLHEVVFSARNQKKLGYKASDIAKRMLDFGMHAPTTYFPLIVPEALMIEPTETESKESLDRFCEAMLQIHRECEQKDPLLASAPNTTPVGRLNDVLAIKRADLGWSAGLEHTEAGS
ncbi:MAG: aminomethyl-transferring glycine dehydrogenase subunit GcvPB [Calditrichaeota bacterium]|nr:aminomethyl-transferring glycine dehydrogenase subunit GcvPB [Calditrichota bacterium]MCB9474757.1 aminomethyl-transferring glycine dehydrogenase subunit GcvPB [Candidatus Delongbacteria bacterium]